MSKVISEVLANRSTRISKSTAYGKEIEWLVFYVFSWCTKVHQERKRLIRESKRCFPAFHSGNAARITTCVEIIAPNSERTVV